MQLKFVKSQKHKHSARHIQRKREEMRNLRQRIMSVVLKHRRIDKIKRGNYRKHNSGQNKHRGQFWRQFFFFLFCAQLTVFLLCRFQQGEDNQILIRQKEIYIHTGIHKQIERRKQNCKTESRFISK